MNSQPKSIFTSQKEFGSQSATVRTSTPKNPPPSSFPKAAVPPSPGPQEDNIDGETDWEVNLQEEATLLLARKSSPDTAGQRRRGSLSGTSLQVIADNILQSINAPLRGRVPSTCNEAFQKPGLPSSQLTTTHASKHPRTEDKGRPLPAEPPSKKNRPKLKPRHTLNPESFHTSITPFPARRPGSPPSPLFFSHSPRQRPIPPTFSSSEAAATMLNRARDEPSGVTTLKLARGSMSSASPPRPTSTPGSWTPIERSSIPRSPDPRSGLQILGSVGIIELLEQDERPTFIIDIANPTNFAPGGPLQIVFANASLRANESILEMVTGKADLDSPGIAVINDFPEFKAWALSFIKNGESLDICLPSFLYGGVTWTCSTLRKRLRLISDNGSSLSANVASNSSNGALSASSNLSARVRGHSLHTLPRSPLAGSAELPDYFGDAVPPSISTASNSPLPVVSSPFMAENEVGSVPKQAIIASQSAALTSNMMQTRYLESSSFDWTRLPMSAALPRHIQFARSIDWAATPLGPIESWGFDLRAMCNLIMGSPHPAAMYWGDEYT